MERNKEISLDEINRASSRLLDSIYNESDLGDSLGINMKVIARSGVTSLPTADEVLNILLENLELYPVEKSRVIADAHKIRG